MPGTFTRCCTCTMYDNKYVGLVLKDSREKQQDLKREEVQGESRFVFEKLVDAVKSLIFQKKHLLHKKVS